MDAFAHPIFAFLTNLLWACVVVWFLHYYRDDVRNLLRRLREAGPTGAKFDPLANEVEALEVQIKLLKEQVRLGAPSDQISGRIAQVQGSLQTVSALVGRLNATEAPDTVSIQGKVG